MVRRITFIIGLGMSLLSAQQASAIPVAPVDLATITLGASVGTSTDEFDNAFAPPPTTGTLDSEVFFDGTSYVYVQTVTPSVDNNFLYNTEFAVGGFTGVAGWRFADAASAGGFGNGLDFQIEDIGGRLVWITTLGGDITGVG